MNKKTKPKWLAWSTTTAFLILIVAISYPRINNRLYVTKAIKVLQGASPNASRSYRGWNVAGFAYQLNGPMPETDFLNCVKTLELTQYDPGQHGPLSTPRLTDLVTAPFWSNEPSGLDRYFFRNSLSERFVVRAKWDNGQIWFLAKDPGPGFGRH